MKQQPLFLQRSLKDQFLETDQREGQDVYATPPDDPSVVLTPDEFEDLFRKSRAQRLVSLARARILGP